jgi:hypothetical protein
MKVGIYNLRLRFYDLLTRCAHIFLYPDATQDLPDVSRDLFKQRYCRMVSGL